MGLLRIVAIPPPGLPSAGLLSSAGEMESGEKASYKEKTPGPRRGGRVNRGSLNLLVELRGVEPLTS
jgi:hypothetical protein